MPTIADAIAALTPPQNQGDQLVVALLQSYARQIAELDAKILRAGTSSQRYYLQDEQQCLRRLGEAVAAVALFYRKNP